MSLIGRQRALLERKLCFIGGWVDIYQNQTKNAMNGLLEDSRIWNVIGGARSDLDNGSNDLGIV